MSARSGMGRLTPEMAALMARMAAETGSQPDPTTMPAAEGRAQTEEGNRRWNADLPPMAAVAEAFVEADVRLGSERVRLKILVPPDPGKGAILFVHGGGFAFCSPESHERCARVLALECGLPVILPDYRLAPEHPYPAGLLDVMASIKQALAVSQPHGVRPGPVILSGDSAGANLALAALLNGEASEYPAIAGALLFYGTYAVDFATVSYRIFRDGPGLTTSKMQRYWHWYAGDHDVSGDPLACPLLASDEALKALPPLYLMAAGVDPLLSDSITLHERLQRLGRRETLTVVPGVIHGFLQHTLDLAAAREALAQAGAEARRMASPD